MIKNETNAQHDLPRLVFAGGFDERAAHETEARGYRSAVSVEFVNGQRYDVVFYDPVRLAQDLEEETRCGQPFISEPGLIIVPDVTLDNMQSAVNKLAREGYFNALVPSAATDASPTANTPNSN